MRPRPPFGGKSANPALLRDSQILAHGRDLTHRQRQAPACQEAAVRKDVIQEAHGLQVGMVVSLSDSDWVRCLGSGATAPIGVVTRAYGADAFEVTVSGAIPYPATTLTPGSVYYPTDSGATYVATTRGRSGPAFVATGTDSAILLTGGRPEPIAQFPTDSASPAIFAGESLIIRTRSWSRYVISSTTYVVHGEAHARLVLSTDATTMQMLNGAYLVWGYSHNSSTGAMGHDGQSGGLSQTPFSPGDEVNSYVTLFGQSSFVRVRLTSTVYSPPSQVGLSATIDYDAGTKTVKTQNWVEKWS